MPRYSVSALIPGINGRTLIVLYVEVIFCNLTNVHSSKLVI